MRQQRPGTRRVAIGLTALLAVTSAADVTAAAPSVLARRALAACHRASLVAADAAAAQLEEGIDLAEQAIDDRAEDPAAHFALFCTLAKQIRRRGIGLSTLFDLARARAALERSLALDPGYVDALAAKGAVLYYAPHFMGGDVDAGERLLRRVLALDPDNPIRLVLVDLLVYREQVDEARREAERSIAAVRTSEDPEAIAAASSLLEHLCERGWPLEVGAVLRTVCPSGAFSVAGG